MSFGQNTDISSCPSSPAVKKTYRLVTLGSSQVGKSCIIDRFLNNKFSDNYKPSVEEFYRKYYRIKGEFYQLDILDTSGFVPYPAARRLSLLTGDLFLLVYSMDNLASYEEVFRLYETILEIKDFGNGKGAKLPIIIVANKMDLPQSKRVTDEREAARRLAEDYPQRCGFVTCSAKLNQGIDPLFKQLFEYAKLPREMSPNAHHLLTTNSSLDEKTVSKTADGGGPTASITPTPLPRQKPKLVNQKSFASLFGQSPSHSVDSANSSNSSSASPQLYRTTLQRLKYARAISMAEMPEGTLSSARAQGATPFPEGPSQVILPKNAAVSIMDTDVRRPSLRTELLKAKKAPFTVSAQGLDSDGALLTPGRHVRPSYKRRFFSGRSSSTATCGVGGKTTADSFDAEPSMPLAGVGRPSRADSVEIDVQVKKSGLLFGPMGRRFPPSPLVITRSANPTCSNGAGTPVTSQSPKAWRNARSSTVPANPMKTLSSMGKRLF